MGIIYIATDCFKDITGNNIYFGHKFKQTNDLGDFVEFTEMSDSEEKFYIKKTL